MTCEASSRAVRASSGCFSWCSASARTAGITTTPDDLFRVATGGEVVMDNGVRFKQDRSLDWVSVTDHAEYLAQVVQLTIEQEMRKEAGYLRSLRLARERVKQVIEGPDGDIDRIIRSVRENGGTLSNKLVQEFPPLADQALADEVVAAILTAFTQS